MRGVSEGVVKPGPIGLGGDLEQAMGSKPRRPPAAAKRPQGLAGGDGSDRRASVQLFEELAGLPPRHNAIAGLGGEGPALHHRMTTMPTVGDPMTPRQRFSGSAHPHEPSAAEVHDTATRPKPTRRLLVRRKATPSTAPTRGRSRNDKAAQRAACLCERGRPGRRVGRGWRQVAGSGSS